MVSAGATKHAAMLADLPVAGVVHDVTDFIRDHPSGKAMIKSGIGKDATAMFNGNGYGAPTAQRPNAHSLAVACKAVIVI